MKSPLASAAILSALLLCSCGTSPIAAIKKITPGMPKIPSVKLPDVKRGDIARFSFKDLLPSSVPVVEVREHELKEIESGKQKVIAYQNTRSTGWRSWFGGPATFKEPALPTGSPVEADYGLLPPKPQ